MDTLNNLNYNSIVFDVILYKSDCYDIELVEPEITIGLKNSYEINYYDIDIVKTIPYDLKLVTSDYYDFELVTDFTNYFNEEILTDLGNEILTEYSEFLMTEDDSYIIY